MPNTESYIKELSTQIEQHNRAYAIGMPYITDSEYDLLWYKLYKIDPNNPLLYYTTKTMECRFGQLKHKKPIYGLNKAFCSDDLKPFITRHKDRTWRIEPKYDGVSAILYNNPDGQQLVLSGNGIIGADVTHHMHAINFNQSSKLFSVIPIELIIPNINWDSSLGSNQRNTVAGLINSSEITHLNLIEAIPYDTSLHYIVKPAAMTIPILEDLLLELYTQWSGTYPMDGLVIKVDSEKDRLTLSHNGTTYNWSIAWKPPIQIATTTVTHIEWNVSRNGRIIPTVIYEPVELCNTVNSRATGNNYRWIKDNKIYVNSEIKIGKAGEIIPKIISSNGQGKEFIPALCPYCGSTITVDGVHLVCNSNTCMPQMVKRIAYFYSDKGMDLHGIGEASIEKLLEHRIINQVLVEHPYALLSPYIYGLTEYIINILGEKTTLNYLDELEVIKGKKNPAHFIAGLGYKNLAYKTAYSIAQQIIGVYNKDNHQGDKVEAFYNGLGIMMKFIEKTSYQFMTIPKESVIKYCITGELSVSRNEMISYLSTYNWLFVNNISKNIKYLILGALPKDSTKLNRAKELGIKIISEDEIYSLLPKEIKDDCTV